MYVIEFLGDGGIDSESLNNLLNRLWVGLQEPLWVHARDSLYSLILIIFMMYRMSV